MRKENEAIKKSSTLQIQELRRQLVTKKAFDEDESQREISRLKKELAFVNKQVYNQKRMAYDAQSSKENRDLNNIPSDNDNQLKVAQAMQDHKKVLESENENLRNRIGRMEQEREYDYNDRSMKGSALMQNYGEDMGGIA